MSAAGAAPVCFTHLDELVTAVVEAMPAERPSKPGALLEQVKDKAKRLENELAELKDLAKIKDDVAVIKEWITNRRWVDT